MQESYHEDDKSDCFEPVCGPADPLGLYKNAYKKFSNFNRNSLLAEEPNQINSAQNTPSMNRGQGDSEKSETKEPREPLLECPHTIESVGFATWNFLHTMAIYLPKKTTPEQQEHLRHFMEGFSWVYPCKHCAGHLRSHLSTRSLQL